MLALLHLWRWGRVKFAAWAAAHPLGGLIVASFAVSMLDRALGDTFSYLFPALSEVIWDTIGHMLPTVFFASGAFSLGLAALFTFVIIRGLSSPRSPGLTLSPKKPVLAVLVLVGFAGIAFLVAHLAGSVPPPVPHFDR